LDSLDLRDRRVLITGGHGFLGRHLVDVFRRQGVTDLSLPRRQEVDLRDSIQTNEMIRRQRPEVIVHLAARVGGIGANAANPGLFFYDNILMGVLLMEAARVYGVAKFVAVGTICAYPKFAPVPFREEDLWNGYPEETNAPYGLAKKMLLVQGDAYRRQYGFNCIYLLPVNLYGPGDNFDPSSSHVIPAMIRKFLEARDLSAPTVVLWGTGTPTREFLYVRDAADAIFKATSSYDDGDPVNIGSGAEISIRDLATMIAEIIGYKGAIVWDATKPDGQPRRSLDVSRARERFGFSATTSFRDGLIETIRWYEDSAEGGDKSSARPRQVAAQ
jgi:GDP-L-fucose synthase